MVNAQGDHNKYQAIKRPIWFCSWRTFRALASYTIAVAQGLEVYSRDPGFHQNTLRDSGKRKMS